MKRLFEIDENEKRRILEMHENATKKLYLSEQPASQSTEQGTPVTPTQGTPRTMAGGTEINGVIYNMIEIDSAEKLNLFLSVTMRQIELTIPNLKYSSVTQAVHDDMFQAMKDALNYGAKRYKSFSEMVCTGGIILDNLRGSSTLFDKLTREFPNIMDVFLPIARQQMRKLGIKTWKCS